MIEIVDAAQFFLEHRNLFEFKAGVYFTAIDEKVVKSKLCWNCSSYSSESDKDIWRFSDSSYVIKEDEHYSIGKCYLDLPNDDETTEWEY